MIQTMDAIKDAYNALKKGTFTTQEELKQLFPSL